MLFHPLILSMAVLFAYIHLLSVLFYIDHQDITSAVQHPDNPFVYHPPKQTMLVILSVVKNLGLPKLFHFLTIMSRLYSPNFPNYYIK